MERIQAISQATTGLGQSAPGREERRLENKEARQKTSGKKQECSDQMKLVTHQAKKEDKAQERLEEEAEENSRKMNEMNVEGRLSDTRNWKPTPVLYFQIDTGASKSFISDQYYKEHQGNVKLVPQ